jgi:UDP-glucose 4-epimerase
VRVLVTGGAGFIGSAVAARLRAEGHQVVVADQRAPADGRDTDVVGDLRDPEVLGAALAEGTDAVAHLAAVTSVLGSVKDPVNVYRTNVALTQDLLERCRQLGVASFVFASTNAVVGLGAGGGVIDESSPLLPLTPYGATKAAGEMLMSAYRRAYDLSCVSLRLTNVYGPGIWVKDGLVARCFKAARGGTGININGDGRQIRDYVYLDDVVAAFVAGLTTGSLPPTVIVGSGVSVDVLEIHSMVAAATGRPIPAEHVPAPPGDMKAVVVDRSLAERSGLAAPVQLAEGLAATWRAWPD